VLDKYNVILGTQLKNLYQIKILTGDILSLCKKTQEKLSNPYSNSLHAMILLSFPDISFISKRNQDFINICNSSTEFHFDSIRDQIDAIKLSNSENKFTTGDVLITKHSNLSDITVVFHLIIEKKNTDETSEKIIKGLKNILQISTRYDISTLTIPVTLVESEIKHLFSENQYQKRITETLKTVRAHLSIHPDSNCLKTIQLVLSSGEKSILLSYFKTEIKDIFPKA